MTRKFDTGAYAIEGYEDLYSITKDGRVFSLYSQKYLKPYVWGKYLSVRLYKDGRKKTVSIHRLLATTFLKNDDENKVQVNHKDGNKLNNCLDNLEWCTVSENQKHAYDFGLNTTAPTNGIKTRFRKGNVPHNKRINNKEVFSLRRGGFSVKTIANELDCCFSTIYRILKKQEYNYENKTKNWC